MNLYFDSLLALQKSTGLSFIPLTIIITIAVIIILATFFKAVSDLLSAIPTLLKHKGKLAVVSISIFFSTMFVSYSYDYVFRPTPYLSLPDINVQNTLYFEWQFDKSGIEDKKIEYLVDITNKSKNKKITTAPMIDNNTSTDEVGELDIQVSVLFDGQIYSKSKTHTVKHYKRTLDKIKHTREMVVGIYNDSSEGTFCYKDEKGKTRGFDIDLIQLIADNLFLEDLPGGDPATLLKSSKKDDINVIFKYHKWVDLMKVVGDGNIDLAIASITIRKDREKEHKIIFSEPYLDTTLAAIGTVGCISKFEENRFNELKFGVVEKTTSDIFYTDVLMAKFKITEHNRYVFEHNRPLFAALDNAEIDIVLYDYIRAKTELEKHPSWQRFSIDPDQFKIEPERYGIVINKNDLNLKFKIDAILKNKELDIYLIKKKYKLI